MNPENHVNIAPQRNHQSGLRHEGGSTLPLVAASSSFWNWTLTRLKK